MINFSQVKLLQIFLNQFEKIVWHFPNTTRVNYVQEVMVYIQKGARNMYLFHLYE